MEIQKRARLSKRDKPRQSDENRASKANAILGDLYMSLKFKFLKPLPIWTGSTLPTKQPEFATGQFDWIEIDFPLDLLDEFGASSRFLTEDSLSGRISVVL